MPAITWDSGTAYDFLVSLVVLHQANAFGLRPSWAAGVRQRISSPRREFLEQFFSFSGTGLEWVSSLAKPKDATDALRQAATMEPDRFFKQLALPAETPEEVRVCLNEVAERGSATRADRDYLKTTYRHRGTNLNASGLDAMVLLWSDARRSGEQLREALEEYHQVFFAEEEGRLRPALEIGLANAQKLAERLPADELVENISHGVRIADLAGMRSLVLAPSFWASPLVFHLRPRPSQTLLVFGVRPTMQGIVPGEETPDLLVSTLKSLADPTRLRILRFLSHEPLSPAGLARRLRLRPPTVTHHLHALRLAGLVQITINDKNEKRYAARLETLDSLGTTLQEFLIGQDRHE